jgi:Rad52/22 family double-strand break repair protein
MFVGKIGFASDLPLHGEQNMSLANGHADGSKSMHDIGAAQVVTTSGAPAQSGMAQFAPDRVKDLVAELQIPFDPMVIEWRVTNTTKSGRIRGQVIPYADPRAYTDRLNELFTPAGWTRKYTVHTSTNFERSNDQKTVAKVFVTCELTIFGLGTHSATGEEWADDQNACTSAQAQAFKRACCCFGLGRYLYYFTGAWVDLDDRKRPKTVPQVAGWATPGGWLEGLRPRVAGVTGSRPNERLPEMAVMATVNPTTMAQALKNGAFFTRSKQWKE